MAPHPTLPAPPGPDQHASARARARAVGAAALAAAPRLALVPAVRLRRPVAVATMAFTIAAAAVVVGGLAAGIGILSALGAGSGMGPALVILAGALYTLPLFLLVSCRNALACYPRFVDVLQRDASTAAPRPTPDATTTAAGRPRRAPVRVIHATQRLLRGAAAPVRAAAEVAGVWRLASPVVSIGGAVAFVAAPVLAAAGIATLVLGLVLA